MTRRTIFYILAILLVGALLAACGGGDDGGSGQTYPPDQVASGEALYQQTCSACHGPEGLGIDNLGKPIAGSQFITERSDAELLAYVKAGRAVDDPLNTTGIAMPPKGGNPALTDEQIQDIIAFSRSIQP